LLQVGFAVPLMLPPARCALTSRKVSGFRINPATQQPCGQSRLPN
jgi:hypothetical protein